EVLAFGDDYDDPTVTLDAPALRHGAATRTQGELLDEAAGQVAAADRTLVTRPFDAGSVVVTLLAPLVAGASVVWCRNADPAVLPARAAAERAIPAP
ncbi:MAG: TIGR03089 family protein, partial [Actinomycetota bacterium]|nr:TIGR03089 family protein [Actinomycetota bacterium]